MKQKNEKNEYEIFPEYCDLVHVPIMMHDCKIALHNNNLHCYFERKTREAKKNTRFSFAPLPSHLTFVVLFWNETFCMSNASQDIRNSMNT
jgi:hypothetical protein